MNNSRCIVLVPANNCIEPACDHALRQLERMGFPVWRVPGFAAIDTARSQLATDAVAQGFEELIWINSDIEFDPVTVERLRSHNLPIVSGLNPKKGTRAFASSLLPETQKIIFGEGGDLLEIRYAATGFLYTKRQVYLDIQRHCNLPVCNLQFNHPLVPFFMALVAEVPEVGGQKSEVGAAPSPRPSPVKGEGEEAHRPALVKGEGEGVARAAAHATGMVTDISSPLASSPSAKRHWYLSEDFASSHRVRQAGYKIFADTTILLGHIGRYSYAWEDAGMSMNRCSTFHFQLSDAKPPSPDMK